MTTDVTQSRRKPRVAVTMGDPAGVGPELCVRALNDPELRKIAQLVVFGDAEVLKEAASATGQLFDSPVSDDSQWSTSSDSFVVDLCAIELSHFKPGTISASTGQASYEYIDAAIRAAQDGSVDAVSTAPISKEALCLAGLDYPGHTEIFAERDGSKRWCMMQYSEAITCTFVTVHCGYADVPALLTQERILDVIQLSAEALSEIRGRPPKVVVCGLNPHAGEAGLFGEGEEDSVIRPAVDAARRAGIDVEGPIPADTAFVATKRAATDVFVCMYHDQGHIPVKALAFDSAVNTTLGLAIIRTSVDHGTALDIAWQGKADQGSLFQAVRLAAEIHCARQSEARAENRS